jgi:hypothetical protein
MSAEIIAFRANPKDVISLNEVVVDMVQKTNRPINRSEVLRALVQDAHTKIVKENT